MRVYKISDKIKIKIDELTFSVSPLSISDKNEVQTLMLEGQKEQNLAKLNDAIHLAIKLSVKDVEGLTDSNNEAYKFTYDNGKMSDENLNDLLNLPVSEKMIKVCSQIVSGVPTDFTIEGVSFVEKK